MSSDETVGLLKSILDEQKRTNRILEIMSENSNVFYNGMMERFYTLDGELVFNVKVVSPYRDD